MQQHQGDTETIDSVFPAPPTPPEGGNNADAWDDPPKRPRSTSDAWDEPRRSTQLVAIEGDILEPDDDDDTDEQDAWKGMTPVQLRTRGPDGLTPKQRAFVAAYLGTEGNGTASAIAAGVSVSCAHVSASRWLRDPHVIAVLRERIGATYVAIAPAMQAAMLKLALNSKSEFVRQQAAKDLLDRAAIQPPEARGINVRVAIDLS